MNEVRNTILTSTVSVRLASSNGAEDTKERVRGEKSSVVSEQETRVKAIKDELAKQKEPEVLEAAVASINDYVQLVQRDLHFSVDDDLEQTVIKVVDSQSGKLIRQIPEDVFLDLARKLKEDGELNLVNALG